MILKFIQEDNGANSTNVDVTVKAAPEPKLDTISWSEDVKADDEGLVFVDVNYFCIFLSLPFLLLRFICQILPLSKGAPQQ